MASSDCRNIANAKRVTGFELIRAFVDESDALRRLAKRTDEDFLDG